MNTKILKITAVILLLAVTAQSCDYEKSCQSGDCETVDIKGSVRVQPSGEGLPNVPVTVELIRTSGQTLAKKVGSGRTDKNGVFDFKGTVDKSFGGNSFYLKVSIPYQNNYLNVANEFDIMSNDFASLRNINFEFYNKAQLTINIKRTQTEKFDSFLVDSFVDDIFHNFTFTISYQNARDATRQIETVTDVYTKIWWWKMLDGKEIYRKVDSLICKQNVNNVFTINY